MHASVAVIAASLLSTVVPVAVAAEGGADVDPDHPLLAEARANVEAAASELADARGDRETATAALAQVDRRLARVEASVNEAAAAVERQRLEVASAGERLAALRVEVEELEERLERRSVALYMNGGDENLASMLAAGDVTEAADRSSYIDMVVGDDQSSLEAAVAARRALEGAAERYEAETDRLEGMLASQEALLTEVEQLRAAQAQAVRAADAEVGELEALQDDLSGEYDRIEELIASGSVTSVAATAPSTAGLVRPVCTSMTSPFGYRWGRLHKGIDLGGNVGDPIAAAKAGTVIHAGPQGAYGNLVLVDHGDGMVTAYAHQSQIRVGVGQSVGRGELIGLVGNTGRSTGPHLHFETRVNGSAVDPLQYLPGSC